MSVGTSLAFEASGGDFVRTADTVMFNLRTLVRNAQQAYEKDDKEQSTISQLVKDVESDLMIIGKWLEQNRKGRPISMIVYYPSYRGMGSKFRHANLWKPTTEKQKAYARLIEDVCDNLVEKHKAVIQKTDINLPEFKGRGVIMTHHVVDLTTTPSIGRLFLLESHTGAVKPYTKWYTKLTGGTDLYYIPFNHLTIQIFGDKSTNFKSSSHGIKELVKSLAVTAKWTSATSMSRVRGTIADLPDSVDKAGLMLML